MDPVNFEDFSTTIWLPYLLFLISGIRGQEQRKKHNLKSNLHWDYKACFLKATQNDYVIYMLSHHTTSAKVVLKNQWGIKELWASQDTWKPSD